MRALSTRRIEAVLAELSWLPNPVMLFGAGILPLYLDNESLDHDLRPTEDLDAMVHLSETGSAHLLIQHIEAQLRAHNWSPDTRAHRKNLHAYTSPSGVAVDLVFDRLYSDGDWPVVAQDSACNHRLPSARTARIPTPAMFLITKIAASRAPSRWDGPYDSHDLEDIALLMAGCSTLQPSVTGLSPIAADYLSMWARELTDEQTRYGQTAYACLEANWPRKADPHQLDAQLTRWFSRE